MFGFGLMCETVNSGGGETHCLAGTIVAAMGEIVNGHLPGRLAVLRRGRVLRVHDGSRRSGYLMLQGVLGHPVKCAATDSNPMMVFAIAPISRRLSRTLRFLCFT